MAGTLRCIAAFRPDPVRSAWLALSICFRKIIGADEHVFFCIAKKLLKCAWGDRTLPGAPASLGSSAPLVQRRRFRKIFSAPRATDESASRASGIVPFSSRKLWTRRFALDKSFLPNADCAAAIMSAIPYRGGHVKRIDRIRLCIGLRREMNVGRFNTTNQPSGWPERNAFLVPNPRMPE